eukprot:scaffold84676_cov69-Phaeocystis_antarctica.AAC.1
MPIATSSIPYTIVNSCVGRCWAATIVTEWRAFLSISNGAHKCDDVGDSIAPAPAKPDSRSAPTRRAQCSSE